MNRTATVLVTASGTIIAQGIIKSLKLANSRKGGKVTYRIVAADMSPYAAGLYRGLAGIVVPAPTARGYIGAIIEACRRWNISAIFVGADEELQALESSREKIEAETGAIVISNSAKVISIGADKWETYRLLKKKGLPFAESALPGQRKEFLREFGLPVVVKPRRGHGSLDLYKARTAQDVEYGIKKIREAGGDPVLQQYLEGDEYTSGVTSDEHGRVVSSIAMRRELKWGQTFRAYVHDFPDVRKAAEEVARAMGSVGPLNVQARKVGRRAVAFEVNPRLSASCPIRAVAGVNEPDILFRTMVLGEKVRAEPRKRLVCFRYLNEVYLPEGTLEETIARASVGQNGSFIPDYF